MTWKLFALGSAFFAGLTAVLGKIGVEKIPSNLATLIRTGVVILLLVGIGMEGGVAPRVRFCARPEITVIELGPPSEAQSRVDSVK